jgi:5-formyltetrahydrofolate cyclo-ligase
MNLEEKIKRINELYHKSQNEGLTDEEKEEQKRLRQEYVESVRNNLKSQLDNINIQEADGSITNLGKKYGKKK